MQTSGMNDGPGYIQNTHEFNLTKAAFNCLRNNIERKL